MKHFIKIFSTILLSVILFSCTKSPFVENDGLVGKWKLEKIYDGYFNGGGFKWTNVSSDDSHTLVFTQSGQYNRKENNTGSFTECSGSYILSGFTNLQVNSNCNTVTENMLISELKSNSLIIDRAGIEGTIRFKYIAVK